MNNILENYLIIIVVGLFFVFALIGYIIDLLRNNKTEDNSNIYPIEIPKEDNKNVPEQSVDVDDLLKSYEDTKE